MRQSIFHYFKTPLVQLRAFYLNPLSFMLLCEMIVWASSNDLNIYISETFTTLEEDTALHRVSSSHREGRAFDAVPNNLTHTAPWPKEKIDKFIDDFSKKYAGIAAIGLKDGKPELIVYHDTGSGLHFHVQINKTFTVTDTLTKGVS